MASSPEAVESYRRAELARAAALRSAFKAEFRAREYRWSGYVVTRMLNRVLASRREVDQAWKILEALRLHRTGVFTTSPQSFGVFDHGEIWGRDGGLWAIVGHPYDISDKERALLEELGRFPGLKVSIDDRPSYYGFHTHHVRIEAVR